MVFRSKTKSEDYHDEMNTQHFMEWFATPFAASLALIIINNAKYHNAVVEKVHVRTNKKFNKDSHEGMARTLWRENQVNKPIC